MTKNRKIIGIIGTCIIFIIGSYIAIKGFYKHPYIKKENSLSIKSNVSNNIKSDIKIDVNKHSVTFIIGIYPDKQEEIACSKNGFASCKDGYLIINDGISGIVRAYSPGIWIDFRREENSEN
jgi:hypothetical protein